MPLQHAIGFTRGILFYLRGFRTIFSSWKVMGLAVAPMVVNVAVIAGFLAAFNAGVYTLAEWAFSSSSQAWYMAMLSVIGGLILFLASLAVAALLFVSVGLILASPFLDALSAEVERSVTGVAPAAGPGIPHVIRAEGKKMAVFLAIQLALALLNLIPVAGSMAFAVLNPLFISFVMAYEFPGYVLDRRGYDFAMKRRRIFENPGVHFGFGAAAGLTLIAPIVQLVLLPVAAAGGTLLALETLEAENDGAKGDTNG